jgi:hypothetical protein
MDSAGPKKKRKMDVEPDNSGEGSDGGDGGFVGAEDEFYQQVQQSNQFKKQKQEFVRFFCCCSIFLLDQALHTNNMFLKMEKRDPLEETSKVTEGSPEPDQRIRRILN